MSYPQLFLSKLKKGGDELTKKLKTDPRSVSGARLRPLTEGRLSPAKTASSATRARAVYASEIGPILPSGYGFIPILSVTSATCFKFNAYSA